MENCAPLVRGQLLLVDAGCELDGYTADVTRTSPIGAPFSPAQRRLYEAVLETQIAAIEAVKPGATLDAIHNEVVERLTRHMVALGLLQGEVPALIESGAYKPFYMHRTSHWLGMDVHDVGFYAVDGAARPLAPGMVLTIEPGLYVAEDANVPPEYRGLGVRIEDDILVTAAGHENLTAAVPKTTADIEALTCTEEPCRLSPLRGDEGLSAWRLELEDDAAADVEDGVGVAAHEGACRSRCCPASSRPGRRGPASRRRSSWRRRRRAAATPAADEAPVGNANTRPALAPDERDQRDRRRKLPADARQRLEQSSALPTPHAEAFAIRLQASALVVQRQVQPQRDVAAGQLVAVVEGQLGAARRVARSVRQQHVRRQLVFLGERMGTVQQVVGGARRAGSAGQRGEPRRSSSQVEFADASA